jgi:hypothetical protein
MPQLFLDCDGVLADFDALALDIFGKPPQEAEAEIGSDAFWQALADHRNFYGELPLMEDAQELVEATEHLNPIILTGVPDYPEDWSRMQKLEWGEKYFPQLKMICCPSPDKRDYIQGPGDVLVDDRQKYRFRWVEKGGIFILHTSAAETIAKLKELGVL